MYKVFHLLNVKQLENTLFTGPYFLVYKNFYNPVYKNFFHLLKRTVALAFTPLPPTI